MFVVKMFCLYLGINIVQFFGEIVKGSYFNEVVCEMSEVCFKVENIILYVSYFEELCVFVKCFVFIVEFCVMVVVWMFFDFNVLVIFVFFILGVFVCFIFKYCFVCFIIMIIWNVLVLRYVYLYCGVYLFFFLEVKFDFSKVNWQEDVDCCIKWGFIYVIDLGVFNEGEMVVVVQGWKGGMGNINILCIVKVDVDYFGIGQLEQMGFGMVYNEGMVCSFCIQFVVFFC